MLKILATQYRMTSQVIDPQKKHSILLTGRPAV